MIVDYANNKIYVKPSNPKERKKLTEVVKHIKVVWADDVAIFDAIFIYALNVILNGFHLEFTDNMYGYVGHIKETDPNHILVVVDAVLTRLYGKDIPEKEINNKMKYFFKPARNHPLFKAKKWDGYISLYKKAHKSFPSGLLNLCEDVMKENKRTYTIYRLYDVQCPVFDFKYTDDIIPTPDQERAVEAAVDGINGIIKAPTAFGKTAVLAAQIICKTKVPTLFIANQKQLVEDAYNDFKKCIIGLNKIGIVGDGVFGDKNGTLLKEFQIIVATVQSINARLNDDNTKDEMKDYLNNCIGLVMIDECQGLGTKEYNKVLEECGCARRIGLSATPKRTDEKARQEYETKSLQLQAYTGPMLFETTAEEQIAKGRLCELNISYMIYDHKLYNQYDKELNYNECYKAWIVDNHERTMEMIVKPAIDWVRNEERFVLILFERIEHGENIYNALLANGFSSNEVAYIYGETQDKLRRKAIDEFRKGNLKVLVGSKVFDAGVNIPVVSGVILAGAGNSEITLVQRIGRGARQCDYEDVLGYLPEFMKEQNRKITKVLDILDANIKFFEKQGWNRYYNAIAEFGETRVKVVGTKTNSKKTKAKKIENEEAIDKQLELLEGFKDKKPQNSPQKDLSNNSFINFFKKS